MYLWALDLYTLLHLREQPTVCIQNNYCILCRPGYVSYVLWNLWLCLPLCLPSTLGNHCLAFNRWLWVKLCPPPSNAYVELPTPNTPESNHIWKWGLQKGKLKMRQIGGSQIQYDWTLQKEEDNLEMLSHRGNATWGHREKTPCAGQGERPQEEPNSKLTDT
jgi:hypothetical protein